jgi:hypothetical protein
MDDGSTALTRAVRAWLGHHKKNKCIRKEVQLQASMLHACGVVLVLGGCEGGRSLIVRLLRSWHLAAVVRQPEIFVLISLLHFRHVANPVYVPLPRGMLTAAVSVASSWVVAQG